MVEALAPSILADVIHNIRPGQPLLLRRGFVTTHEYALRSVPKTQIASFQRSIVDIATDAYGMVQRNPQTAEIESITNPKLYRLAEVLIPDAMTFADKLLAVQIPGSDRKPITTEDWMRFIDYKQGKAILAADNYSLSQWKDMFAADILCREPEIHDALFSIPDTPLRLATQVSSDIVAHAVAGLSPDEVQAAKESISYAMGAMIMLRLLQQ